MAVDAASGHPQYSGNFIPEIWSGTFLVKFYDATCLSQISNTDYAGEIKKQGDVVHIRTVPDININDYVKGQTLKIQHPDSDMVDLEIDKSKYFAPGIDDIDAYQSDMNMLNAFSEDATKQMSIVVERDDVFANIYSDAHASNKGASAGAISGDIDMGALTAPRVLTKSDVLDGIVDCSVVLSENNAPDENRFGIIPQWMGGMIMKSELKDASLAGDGVSIYRNGRLGINADIELFKSNLLTSASDSGNTCFHSIFGQKKALCFAAQMTELEHISPALSFEKAIKGLNVYGYKVLKSQALIDFYIRKGV